ncbi:M16 family metallopeptidase [Shimia ponticola]|uniref:M16 family metallopeptidase n=1 Tax=Shimia ponticola TaxID=2582893 RepID=UPI0011BDF2DD|nr:pitrilysin family protein [Shimia ponticola]
MIRRFLTAAIVVLAAAPVWAEVKIQEVTSPGGITAWLVEERSIPFTALEIRFRGGASLDQPDTRGAVNLMMALLEEGAGDMDARAFTEAEEALAARFSWDAYDDEVTISAEFLTENRDASIDLLREAIINPRFDQDAIDRVKSQVVSIIGSDARDQDEIARSTFYSLAFPDDLYGSSKDGTLATVAAITQEDLSEAHTAALAKDRLYVGAVGDISAEELAVILDRLLGDLPDAGAPIPGSADFAMDGGVTVVDFPSPQSTALFGHEGIAQNDDDFFPAFILNHVLGGAGTESRLGFEVREKRGLTYGIGSYLVPRDRAEMYLGQVRSSNDRIAEALEVTKSEWARTAQEGITAEELETAKTYLTGAYPLRFDGNTAIANILAGMQMSDLGIDYIDTRNDRINAVTLEDVNRVAAELLQPDNLHFVVVGQPEGLEATN